MALSNLTSVDARLVQTVLVPVGSTEQHGPHLPLNTDTAIAQAVVDAVVDRLVADGRPVASAPAVAYGSSGEHQHFAGTISIGTEALVTVLVELARSLRTWANEVVFVNAHGGNVFALERAVDQLAREGHAVRWIPCATERIDLHAGRTETSLMMWIAPDDVVIERAEVGNTAPLAEILPTMIRDGVIGVSPNGVLGDPTGASPSEGGDILAGIVIDVLDRLDR